MLGQVADFNLLGSCHWLGNVLSWGGILIVSMGTGRLPITVICSEKRTFFFFEGLGFFTTGLS